MPQSLTRQNEQRPSLHCTVHELMFHTIRTKLEMIYQLLMYKYTKVTIDSLLVTFASSIATQTPLITRSHKVPIVERTMQFTYLDFLL